MAWVAAVAVVVVQQHNGCGSGNGSLVVAVAAVKQLDGSSSSGSSLVAEVT